MKNTLHVILLGLFAILLSACKTTEYITVTEKQTDTLWVEKTIDFTDFRVSTIEKTEEIKSDLFLPCPDPESPTSPASGSTKSGSNYSEWKWNNDKQGYDVQLYCAAQINTLDSINQKLQIENSMYKSQTKEITSKTQIVKENKSFLQQLQTRIWQILFFLILALWIFGITPGYFFKQIR